MEWQGKRVFLTGHTGFKGSWLSLWLQKMGAVVRGFSLDPPTTPNLFQSARVAEGMESVTGDIRNLEHLQRELVEFRPDIVLHLAAQPLVRLSYKQPIETYSTNVMGTANLLEACRYAGTLRAVVVVTTDKCYENQEWLWPYRENDRLGGYDPYSSSKAAAELVTSSFRNSFFSPENHASHGVAVASARAGNVIGGGDWASDRLIPDIVRGFASGVPVPIRYPHATRPWQHVLEPLRGYLLLAEALYEKGPAFAEAWNFGPREADALPVQKIVSQMAALWGRDARWELDEQPRVHEAGQLRLDWSKAAKALGWQPHFSIGEALRVTVAWYLAERQGKEMQRVTLDQIEAYMQRTNEAAATESPA